jgi:hypothetical protein
MLGFPEENGHAIHSTYIGMCIEESKHLNMVNEKPTNALNIQCIALTLPIFMGSFTQ